MGIISDYCVLAGESEEDPPLFFTPFLNVLMTSGTPERLAWSEYIYLLSLRLCLALHRFFITFILNMISFLRVILITLIENDDHCYKKDGEHG